MFHKQLIMSSFSPFSPLCICFNCIRFKLLLFIRHGCVLFVFWKIQQDITCQTSESMKNETFKEEHDKCLMILYLQMRSDSCKISVSQIKKWTRRRERQSSWHSISSWHSSCFQSSSCLYRLQSHYQPG